MSLQATFQIIPAPARPLPETYSLYRLMAMVPASALVTLLLMYLMHRLVFVEEVILEEPPVQSIEPFFMEETVIETNIRETPEKPDEVKPPPPVEPVERVIPDLHKGDDIFMGTLRVFEPVITARNGLSGGSLIRQVAVPPQYPGGPLSRGVEGFVDIEFDVTAYGATANIRILQSQPEGVFDRAATKAVKRWKYKPRYVEGEAVAAYNIRERIRFTIEK